MKRKNNNAHPVGYFFATMWWKIFLLLLVGAIPTSITITALTRVRDNQIIEFFIDGGVKDNSIYEKFRKSLPKEDGIIEVRSTTIPYTDQDFMAILKTKVGICADFLILSESFLSNRDTFLSYAYQFKSEEKNYITTSYSDLTPRMYYGSFIGFKIYEPDNEAYNANYQFNEYFNFTDTMYMFIDATSTELSRASANKYSVAINAYAQFIECNKKSAN